MAKYCFINLMQFKEDVCNENGNSVKEIVDKILYP